MCNWKEKVSNLKDAVLVLENESIKLRDKMDVSDIDLKDERNKLYFLKDKSLKLLFKTSYMSLNGYYDQIIDSNITKIYSYSCLGDEILSAKNIFRKKTSKIGDIKGKIEAKELDINMTLDEAIKLVKEVCHINDELKLDQKEFKNRIKQIREYKKNPLSKKIEVEVCEIKGDTKEVLRTNNEIKEEIKIEETSEIKVDSQKELKEEVVKDSCDFEVAETKLVEIDRIRLSDEQEVLKEKLAQDIVKYQNEIEEKVAKNKRTVKEMAINVEKDKEGRKVVYRLRDEKVHKFFAFENLDLSKIHVNIAK
ncbi:hypothetical protein WG909_03855 [Peptostreptococcaceae bacterium AGR-M142]